MEGRVGKEGWVWCVGEVEGHIGPKTYLVSQLFLQDRQQCRGYACSHLLIGCLLPLVGSDGVISEWGVRR